MPGILGRFRGLYGLPVQLATLCGVGFALARRDRPILMLAAAACLWVATETVLVLYGWGADPRYLFVPAAAMVVVAAPGVGRALAHAPAHPWPLRLLGPVAVTVLVVALVPVGRANIRRRARHG